MGGKKSIDEKLEDEFNLPTTVGDIIENPIVLEAKLVPRQENLDKDFEVVRTNLYDIISKGQQAIEGILHVASEGDSPRAYEVVSQLIKSVSDANKDLLQLHKELKQIKQESNSGNQSAGTITNQSIFVGSTTDLQKLLKGKVQEIQKLEGEL